MQKINKAGALIPHLSPVQDSWWLRGRKENVVSQVSRERKLSFQQHSPIPNPVQHLTAPLP